MRFLFLLGFLLSSQGAYSLEVTLLTQQGQRHLKTWTSVELKTLANKKSEISAQKLIIDESTKNLELNDRADVDLITFFDEKGTFIRVPRFMIWKGLIKLEFKKGILSSHGESERLLVPSARFRLSSIQKIELSKTSLVYPNTKLLLRTNPAASRGEKLFTQSCLACHTLSGHDPLPPLSMTTDRLKDFAAKHKTWGLELDSRAFRGLVAYRDALASEKSEVKSSK